MIAPPTATEPAGPPDWTTIAFNVICPLCEYNLRGLIESRCPECGYRFEWPEVLDPRRRLHPYLFEHHPERNVRSFLRTALNGLRPRKFWTSLQPIQPPNVKRLIIYWWIGAGICIAAAAANLICVAAMMAAQDNAFRTSTIQSLMKRGQSATAANVIRTTQPTTIGNALGRTFQWQRENLVLFLVIPLLWPWLTFLSLLIFRFSMRRAGVKPIHVLRCCLYSFDLAWCCGLVLLAGTGLRAISGAQFIQVSLITVQLNLLWFAIILFGIVRLMTAYSRYLRFHMPIPTVIASQIITFLIVLFIPLTLSFI